MKQKISTHNMLEIARVNGESVVGKWKMVYVLRPKNGEGLYTEFYKLFYDNDLILEMHSKSRDKSQWFTVIKEINVINTYQCRVVTKFVNHFGLFSFNATAFLKEAK